jgi:hypothetical protein
VSRRQHKLFPCPQLPMLCFVGSVMEYDWNPLPEHAQGPSANETGTPAETGNQANTTTHFAPLKGKKHAKPLFS